MKVDLILISDLVFDPANAREHSQANLDAIKGSLAKFGQQKPIVINKNNVVIAGNGTLSAAQALGWEKVACVKSKLGRVDQTAFALADNRSAELANWNDEILGKTLQALCEDNFDIDMIGFDMDAIDSVDLPELSDGDKSPFRQITFTLHNDQADDVEAALDSVIKSGVEAGENTNINGNALHRICVEWLAQKI